MHTLCARGTMKPEINAAVGFLTRFLRVKGHVNDRQVQTFSQSLHDILAGKKKKRILRTELHPARCQISLYTEFGWLWVTYWLNLGCLCGERSLRRSFFVLSKYHYQRSPARTLFAHVWGGGWKKTTKCHNTSQIFDVFTIKITTTNGFDYKNTIWWHINRLKV